MMQALQSLRFGLAVALCCAGLAQQAAAQNELPPGFVYLRDVDPSIAQDIRYATANNFVGRPLPGYDAPECILRRDAAEALRRVQADLASVNLGLKVYDCYRPERAVRAMWDWAHDGKPVGANARFFPRIKKAQLFALGYVSAQSEHTLGTTADLTLIERGARAAAALEPGRNYASCIAPVAERMPDNSLDMGTGFDCLDVNSHTASATVSSEQRQRRMTLLRAMNKRGFRNYFREWWHFTYAR
jgi:D-alanyl-D-alanine dipeptidase